MCEDAAVAPFGFTCAPDALTLGGGGGMSTDGAVASGVKSICCTVVANGCEELSPAGVTEVGAGGVDESLNQSFCIHDVAEGSASQRSPQAHKLKSRCWRFLHTFVSLFIVMLANVMTWRITEHGRKCRDPGWTNVVFAQANLRRMRARCSHGECSFKCCSARAHALARGITGTTVVVVLVGVGSGGRAFRR